MTVAAARQSDKPDEELLDLARLFPADPDLMVSREGDAKGLRHLKEQAQRRMDTQATQ